MSARPTGQPVPEDNAWDFNALATTYDQQVGAEHGKPYHVWGDYQKCSARVLELAAPVVGMNAIDVATGTGVLAIALAQAGCSVLAVDPSAEMLAQGQH